MKHWFTAAIASALIAGIGAGFVSEPASAVGPAEVIVTNTASHAIPVLPQGTTNISGNVNAVQSGVWSVDLTDEPGRNPYQLTLNFSANPPSACRAIPTSPQVCDFQFPPIPAGQRLVLTNITGLVFVDPPGVVGRIEFLFGPAIGTTLVGPYPNSSNGGTENMVTINARVLWFFDSSPRLRINASAPIAIDNNGTVTSTITFSGYLVTL